MNRRLRLWKEWGSQRREAISALTAVQSEPTHRGKWITHKMTRLLQFGAIIAVVLLICAGLLAVQAHRLGVPANQYGRFAIEYGRLAIGDFLTYVESSLTRPSTDFRFENYDPDEFDSVWAMAEAAEADLYELFPKGTDAQPFVNLMDQMGATCYDVKQPDSVISCLYVYPNWEHFIRWGIHWSIDLYRDESGEKVERFRIKVRGRL